MRLLLSSTAVATWLVCSGAAWAEPGSTHPEYRWLSASEPGELEPLEALAPARAQELAAQGYGYVELEGRTSILLKRNGDVETRLHGRRQYLSEVGVQQQGDLAIYALANRDRAVYERAYVQTPDGSRRAVPFESLQVRPDEGRNIFSDQRVIIVPLGGLEVGTVASLDFRVLRSKQDWPFPWSSLVYLRAPVPIEHFELLVEWEPGVEPPVWLSGEPDASCAPVGPRGLRCTRERVPALETDPDVRSYLDVTPTLVVRSPQTWSEIAGVELAQLETALASTPELDAQARSLAKGAGSSREILGRIQRFVSDQIRYVGEEQGIWAVRPHPAAQTLQRRFGDCKDKVALFVALARRAGLEAEGVLVSTQHFSLDSLIAPSFSWFDHMIACAQGTDLERRCVDLTDPDTASGELPAMVAGAVALDLRPGAEQPYTLERPRFGARASLKTERRLNCDGSIEERNVRSFGGALDTAFRAGLRPRVQQERVRFAVESYEEIVGKTEAIKSTLRHVDDVKGPVEIEDEVRLKARVNWAELSEYAALDRWLQALAQEVASNNKHHARDGAGLEFESETSFEICDRYVVESVGPSLDFQHPLGALSRSYARTAKGVVVRTRLAVPGARIPPEDLARLNRLVEIFLENGEVSFTVKPR